MPFFRKNDEFIMEKESLIPPYQGKFRSILLFGPPGAGKGTIGKTLSSVGNHIHLSSGDIFRGLSPDSPAGRLFHSYAGKGLLVPDDATIEIWRYFVMGLMATNRYFPEKQLLLLDGVPRTHQQVKLMDAYIDVKGIIVLQVNNTDELIQRLQKRAVLENRADDAKADVLKKRMEVYEEYTKQVLAHYPSSLIHTFNGAQPPLQVLRDVLIGCADLLSFN